MIEQTRQLKYCSTMRLTRGVVVLSLLAMGLVWGCMGVRTAKRPVMEFYSLNYDPPAIGTHKQLPFIVLVKPFQGVPPYDTTRIIYSKDRFTRNRYFYHQWIAEPGEMVAQLLARDIRKTNIVKAVMLSDDSAATHVIKGVVEDFYEQDSKEKWSAILSITVTLIRKDKDDRSKICLQKNYALSQPCEEKSPKGLSDAMSIAMSKVSERIIEDISKALCS